MKQEFIESISHGQGTFIENPKNVLIGKYRGYYTVIYKISRAYYEINMNAAIKTSARNEIIGFINSHIGSDKKVKECAYDNCKFIITFKKKKNLVDQIINICDTLVDYLEGNRVKTCCAYCGRTSGISPYVFKKNVQFLCDGCCETNYEIIYNKKKKRFKKEKYLINTNKNYAKQSKEDVGHDDIITKPKKEKKSKKGTKQVIQTGLGTGYMYSQTDMPKLSSKRKNKDKQIAKEKAKKDLEKKDELSKWELKKQQEKNKKSRIIKMVYPITISRKILN